MTKTNFQDKIELFQEDDEECLIVGSGEFELALEVKVACYEPQETDDDDDDAGAIDVAIVTRCSDNGKTTFALRSR
jgi:hypothetical protein